MALSLGVPNFPRSTAWQLYERFGIPPAYVVTKRLNDPEATVRTAAELEIGKTYLFFFTGALTCGTVEQVAVGKYSPQVRQVKFRDAFHVDDSVATVPRFADTYELKVKTGPRAETQWRIPEAADSTQPVTPASVQLGKLYLYESDWLRKTMPTMKVVIVVNQLSPTDAQTYDGTIVLRYAPSLMEPFNTQSCPSSSRQVTKFLDITNEAWPTTRWVYTNNSAQPGGPGPALQRLPGGVFKMVQDFAGRQVRRRVERHGRRRYPYRQGGRRGSRRRRRHQSRTRTRRSRRH